MKDFYKELQEFKESNSLTFSDLGKIISVSGDTFRMAMSRRTFSDLRINILKKYMENEQKRTEESIVYEGVEIPLTHLALLAVENEDKLMGVKIFANMIELRAVKKLVEITASEEALISYRERINKTS